MNDRKSISALEAAGLPQNAADCGLVENIRAIRRVLESSHLVLVENGDEGRLCAIPLCALTFHGPRYEALGLRSKIEAGFMRPALEALVEKPEAVLEWLRYCIAEDRSGARSRIVKGLCAKGGGIYAN